MKKGILETPDLEAGIRLNKFLSDAGFCSRREADRLIESNKVYIDGKPCIVGQKVMPGQKVSVNGKEIKRNEKLELIAFNKPRGIECTTSKDVDNNIVDYINYKTRIYPIGRLDKDSEGLILLTNDGSIVNGILKGSNYHEKEYQVVVDKPVTEEFLDAMRNGVKILDTVTRPCKVRKLGKCKFDIILTQGLNRQIRRMCEALGYRVRQLERIRIMNIKIGDLKTGEYREVTKEEYDSLINILQEKR